MNKLSMAIAAGALLLAAMAAVTRAPQARPEEHRQSRVETPQAAEPSSPAPPELPSTESLDVRVATFVERLKSEGSGDLLGMIQDFPAAEVLGELFRQGPLEEGFLALHRMVAGNPTLRLAVVQVVADEDVDHGTRLFALRLLPPFGRLSGDLERAPLLRQADRPLSGELGRQLVRFVGKPPAGPEVAPWLSGLASHCADAEVRAEAFRAMARCSGPVAESSLRRWIEDPTLPAFHGAAVLGVLAAPGEAERFPWLPAALESWIRVRPADPFDSDSQQRAFHAVAILGRAGDLRRLSSLLEDASAVSEPEKRAFIAFGLRWLPGPEAEATLTSMASNPDESPKVRVIALESLRGRSPGR